MRALFPEPDPVVDLYAHYASDWVADGGLRVNFVASVDGAGAADGTSRGLQTPGDNRVFGVLRDLADVVLVGAGTAVTEGYRPIRLDSRRRAVRETYGLAESLPIAVTSRTLRMDPTSALFADAPEGARTIVLTSAVADADARAAFERVADVVSCGTDTVDPALVRAALIERGYRRILSEGGPTAFADLVRAGVADELCLTVSPLLSGPGPDRIVGGAAWPHSRAVRLHSLLEEDGALFARYRISS